MTDDPAKNPFEQELRRALNHLYDPAQLRNSWLAGLFDVKEQEDVVSALRRILTAAIEALKPARDVPAQSNPWRNYQVLQHRFVEQFTQREVASSLGLSIRQLRRQEKQAVAELADHLWIQNDLAHRLEDGVPQPSRMDYDAVQKDLQTPSLRKELEWSYQSLPNEAVQVKDVILAVLEVVGPLADALDVEIEYTIPDALPRLAMQPITVRQALLNVFTALVSSVKGGKVDVEVRAGRRELQIQIVAQNSRTHPARAEDDDSGDSLEMARELAEFSGGRLEIEGNPLGGARFSACLVLPTEKQSTVLAIDDNPDTLRLLDRYTAGTAYLFHGERDPHQALALAAQLAPELIVLDVMLPGIDGWDLLGRLRQHPKLAHTRIVVCTILPQESLALSLGASAFLRKPIDRKAFLSTLDAQVNLLR